MVEAPPALDHVIHVCLGEPDLEFVRVGDDAVDPLQQARTLNILVGAGVKTIAGTRRQHHATTRGNDTQL